MKRFFDLLLVFTFAPLCIPIIFIIAICVKMTSKGDILFWSQRIGAERIIFNMPKFRTMRIDAPNIATHLMDKPELFYTPIGKFLRSSSLDELPQLWSILRGDMSFVGPRPALYNQHDLIELREKKGLNHLIPGLTGWAQVNGRDDNTIPEKVSLEERYLEKQSFATDLYILFLTFFKVLKKDNISH